MRYFWVISVFAIILPIIDACRSTFDYENGVSDTARGEIIYYDCMGEVISKITQFGHIIACGAFAYYIIGFVALISRAYFKNYYKIQENVVPQADFIADLEEAAKRAICAGISIATARNIAEASGKHS